jgi:hypothetical protein
MNTWYPVSLLIVAGIFRDVMWRRYVDDMFDEIHDGQVYARRDHNALLWRVAALEINQPLNLLTPTPEPVHVDDRAQGV